MSGSQLAPLIGEACSVLVLFQVTDLVCFPSVCYLCVCVIERVSFLQSHTPSVITTDGHGYINSLRKKAKNKPTFMLLLCPSEQITEEMLLVGTEAAFLMEQHKRAHRAAANQASHQGN